MKRSIFNHQSEPIRHRHTEDLMTQFLILACAMLSFPCLALAQTSENRAFHATTDMISLDSDGNVGFDPGGTQTYPTGMSWNGSYTVFVSDASYLDSNDHNNMADVYLYQRTTGAVTRISKSAAGGDPDMPSLHGDTDGNYRYVVYHSEATNIVEPDANSFMSDIYLYNMNDGTTRRISVNNSGAQLNGNSWFPRINANGTHVVFESNATNYASGAHAGVLNIFIYDIANSTLTLASPGIGGAEADGPSYVPVVDSVGEHVAFESDASNLVSGDTNGVTDVFVYNVSLGTVSRVSVRSDGSQTSRASYSPAIDDYGYTVAYVSRDTGMVDGDTNGFADIFASSIGGSPQTMRLSVADDGTEADGGSYYPEIGQGVVAFESSATNLVNGDTNGKDDIFLRDLSAQRNVRMSESSYGIQGSNDSWAPVISGDGRFVAFTSLSAEMHPKAQQPFSQSYAYLATWDRDVLPSPVIALWNGFLGMTNVLELVNRSGESKQAVVRMLGPAGGSVAVDIPASSQRDIILNELPGFSADQYGIVSITSLGQGIDGRVFYYRPQAGTEDYEFAFAMPLVNPLHGPSSVAFNTYQPSLNPADRDNPVLNWLSIVNLKTDLTGFPPENVNFEVTRYSSDGAVLDSQTRTVPPGERRDYDGGHGSGPNRVGYNEIVPSDLNAPYIAMLVRYGSNSQGGYDFAFPLQAQAAYGDTWIGVSSGGGAQNWVEIQNVSADNATVNVEYYDNLGSAVAYDSFALAGPTARHVEAGALVTDGRSGAMRITNTSINPDTLIVQSMFYFRDATGSINSMYGTQGNSTIAGWRSGSWNLFLDQYNWLRVFNTCAWPMTVYLTTWGDAGVNSSSYDLPAHGGRDFGLHDTATYHTAVNAYGRVNVNSACALTELLRIRPQSNGSGLFDYVAPTMVRR